MPGLEVPDATAELQSPSEVDETVAFAQALRFEPRVWASRLGDHTPTTISLPLPPRLIAALFAGTLSVPNVALPEAQDDTWFDGTPVVEAEPGDAGSDVGAVEAMPVELLELLNSTSAEIDRAIERLGGIAVPKLGHVAPSDATWVSFTRSLRCERATDVFALIGASERVMEVVDVSPPPALALRSCVPGIDSTMEYRVFVRSQEVVGLSQRNVRASSTLEQRDLDRVVEVVTAQFEDVVASALVDYAPLEGGGYTYDVFVSSAWRVWILDVAPWGDPTDALLFSWAELEAAEWIEGDGRRAQMRCVGAGSSIRPAQTMYDAMPVELRGTNSTEALAAAAQRLAELERSGAEDG